MGEKEFFDVLKKKLWSKNSFFNIRLRSREIKKLSPASENRKQARTELFQRNADESSERNIEDSDSKIFSQAEKRIRHRQKMQPNSL